MLSKIILRTNLLVSFSNRFVRCLLTTFVMEEDKNLKHELTDAADSSAKKIKADDKEADEHPPTIAQQLISKFKMKKFVVLLSYCGRGYYGMQRQSDSVAFPTIEDDLLKAMLKVGVIYEGGYKNMSSLRFQRAARTDKGVSAVKQIISMNLPDQFNKCVPYINEHLPKQIRVIAGKMVTKCFDSKNFCDARTYCYLMPSFAISPIDALTCETFRVTPEIIKEFNEVLSMYKGTRNFHNFTSQKAHNDASAMRYIMEMECGEPFVKEDMEFVVIRVKGQSFMLHQIRKMIGLAIAVMKGFATKDTIKKAFNSQRLDIPRAPGLGLMLEEVHYNRYNQRYGGDGIHEAILWDDYNEKINEFKQQYIYPVIYETEKKEKSMLEWMQTLVLHTYDVREPGPPGLVKSERTTTAFGLAYRNVKNEEASQLDKDEGEIGENDDDDQNNNDDKNNDEEKQESELIENSV